MEAVTEGFGRAGGEGGGCERTAGEGSGSTGEKAQKPARHVWYDPLEETVIPCTVCNGRANGFHYGADTCAACKVLFSLPTQNCPIMRKVIVFAILTGFFRLRPSHCVCKYSNLFHFMGVGAHSFLQFCIFALM